MKNDFEARIKTLERELINIKTAQEFSSVSTSSTTYSELLTTGNYRIVFDNNGGEILSIFFVNDPTGQRYGVVYALPPSGNTQVVQINATEPAYPDLQTPVHFSVRLTIVSNYPVTSITRIS